MLRDGEGGYNKIGSGELFLLIFAKYVTTKVTVNKTVNEKCNVLQFAVKLHIVQVC